MIIKNKYIKEWTQIISKQILDLTIGLSKAVSLKGAKVKHKTTILINIKKTRKYFFS